MHLARSAVSASSCHRQRPSRFQNRRNAAIPEIDQRIGFFHDPAGIARVDRGSLTGRLATFSRCCLFVYDVPTIVRLVRENIPIRYRLEWRSDALAGNGLLIRLANATFTYMTEFRHGQCEVRTN